MKNVKISTKITLGFGIVIVFIAAMAIISSIISTLTLSSVNSIVYNSTIQTEANTALDKFSLAMASAKVLYNVISDEEYQKLEENVELSKESISKIYEYIASYPELEVFRADIVAFEESLLRWDELTGELQRSNEKLVEIKNMTEEDAGHLQDKFTGTVERYVKNGFPEPDIIVAAQLGEAISEVHLQASHMMDTYDNTSYEYVVGLLSQLVDKLVLYAETENNTEKQAEWVDIAYYARGFLNSTKEYSLELTNNNNIIEQAETLGTNSYYALKNAVNNLDTAVYDQVHTTSDNATSSRIIIGALSLLSLVPAFIMSSMIKRSIKKPIELISNLMNGFVKTGNFNIEDIKMREIKLYAANKDELGETLKSFEELLTMLNEKIRALEILADGDLTVEVDFKSDKDTMALSLSKMIENLNSMFLEISNSAVQVSEGSKQLSEGAVMLSEGSSEQASGMEELSASIQEITGLIKTNTNMADDSAQLANTIKESAEKGSIQMEQMLKAVHDINISSQSISKVMKVIDDIAFQTNILALNASVEAARAGQHGKGFAIVAEEVRNLATKSAEAAKETSTLISNSMEKSTHGEKIAKETSKSLFEIVDGIKKSSEISAEISESSKNQMESINQFGIGINQVANVVQRNAATAEQTAATSQVMSHQASVLNQLIGRFKIKNANTDFSSNDYSNNKKNKKDNVHKIELIEDTSKY